VRQALKNQKRNQKIAANDSQLRQPAGGALHTTTGSQASHNGSGSNQGSVGAAQRIQRLRISSNNKMKPLEAENFQAPATGGAQAPN